MRLFISYARVDKPYCQQIIDTLDIHEIWYDYRLHAGQKWWDEILRQLNWCEGVVYLMSPDSVKSEYCQKELAIAEKLGKHIFPVLIHTDTVIPVSLRDFQYADLSKGLDAKAAKILLNAIYIAERDATPKETVLALPAEITSSPTFDHATLIDQAADAIDTGNFDRAVFLLKHAGENGYESRFVDIHAVLREAESALEKQAYLREAEREYRPIVILIKRQSTFKLGCKAFLEYRKYFPDYDPDNLVALCVAPTVVEIPHVEWCNIPQGEVMVDQDQKRAAFQVNAFKMARHPITNRQFQLFVDAVDGYQHDKWWTFLPEAAVWHQQHPKPFESSTKGDDNLRTNVCWYEAMAFCSWFTEKTGVKVILPSQQQWLRAALVGGQSNNLALPSNALPIVSSAWEWCADKLCAGTIKADLVIEKEAVYAVHGSRAVSNEPSRNSSYYQLKPLFRYHSIGFRIASSE
jgi:hypothetical protein